MTDSTTLDLTVSGTGTAADPYDITGTVILDPAPPGGGDNLLQAGPDGLFLECEQVRGCLGAGDGAAYDPADGEISARLAFSELSAPHLGVAESDGREAIRQLAHGR
ncbi:hypothetical protein ACFYSJ_39465 [Streptomyces sp. NPDC005248]|uniref:hypothetical protein n=1 Tax=Streptomyces sp. NPDC005248 TaxID=3364709 RepID=UPI0036817D3B